MLSITILGSGGPIANRSRASSGTVVSVDGAPRILVDAGGGTYERLGRGDVNLSELDFVLLSHTHIDHSGGLAPVIFNLYLRERKRHLAIAGPAGRDMHPGCTRFAELLFGTSGAWSYLNTFNQFGIDAYDVPSDPSDATIRDVPLDATSLHAADIRVRAVAVSHGMMPSLAYRIDAGKTSVTFSGDVSSASPALVALARGTDVLVHDMALPERDVPHGELHAKPSAVGAVARDAGVGRLIVTHFMPPIETELDAALAIVRSIYAGPVIAATDSMTVDVASTK